MRRKIFTVIFTRCKCPSYRWISPENYPYYGENTSSTKRLQLCENYGSYPSILQCVPRVLAHTLVHHTCIHPLTVNTLVELSLCHSYILSSRFFNPIQQSNIPLNSFLMIYCRESLFTFTRDVTCIHMYVFASTFFLIYQCRTPNSFLNRRQ